MDWIRVSILALVLLFLLLAYARTEVRVRRIVLLLVLLPAALLLVRWASYRKAWWELATALVIAALAFAVWWFALGRRLPPASSDSIRVWTKDDPF
jgi:asparagine N-glycosylation enzyme membrane subunit Stt3